MLEAVVKREVRWKNKPLEFKDRDCTWRKKKVYNVYKRWKKSLINQDKYIAGKGRLVEFLEMKKNKWKEEEKKELRTIHNEAAV